MATDAYLCITCSNLKNLKKVQKTWRPLHWTSKTGLDSLAVFTVESPVTCKLQWRWIKFLWHVLIKLFQLIYVLYDHVKNYLYMCTLGKITKICMCVDFTTSLSPINLWFPVSGVILPARKFHFRVPNICPSLCFHYLQCELPSQSALAEVTTMRWQFSFAGTALFIGWDFLIWWCVPSTISILLQTHLPVFDTQQCEVLLVFHIHRSNIIQNLLYALYIYICLVLF